MKRPSIEEKPEIGLGEEEEEEILGEGEEEKVSLSSGEKKRRLGTDQVKALEKNFEIENKLEPERKVKLAQELGLQPRQVAVWFQNRRARWKTKQLERDFGILKSEHESLKLKHDVLKHENDALLTEIKELKAKLAGDGERGSSVKEEPEPLCLAREDGAEKKKSEMATQDVVFEEEEEVEEDASLPAFVHKDLSSDSDTSAILNDENSSNYLDESGGILSNEFHHHHLQQQQQPQMLFEGMMDCSSPSLSSSFQWLHGKGEGGRVASCNYYQHHQQEEQLLRMEEDDFLSGGSSSIFSDEQVPTLPWYCSDQWD